MNARRTLGLALDLRFDELGQGKAALLATEAATNLLKHAGGGTLIVQGFDFGQDASGLEVLAIDSGQGISDIGQCETDGDSTAGSPGNGMGAMRRLADSFEIYSDRESGTVSAGSTQPISTTCGRDRRNGAGGRAEVAVPGEEVCGDAWAVTERDGRHLCCWWTGWATACRVGSRRRGGAGLLRVIDAREPDR